MDGLGPPGARSEHGQPARIEAMDHLAHSLVVAADRLGDLNGALAAGGSEQDLGAAEDKGIGRAQAGLQRLALGGRERPHIDRRSHANKYQAFPPILAGTALVTIAPYGDAEPEVNDVVLVKVRGREYLHLIKARQDARYLIGNNRGGLNGWVGRGAIFGRAT